MIDRVQSLIAIAQVQFGVLVVAALVAGLAAHLLLRFAARRALRRTSALRTVLDYVDRPARVLLYSSGTTSLRSSQMRTTT